MKKIVALSLFVLFSVLFRTSAYAQYDLPTFGIHLTNPLGFFYKAGAKIEYRFYSENALLLGYTQYFAYFPGYQADFEYRAYFHTTTLTENLVYAKIGTGYAGYQSSSLFSSGTDMNKAPGPYYFAGAGVGKHFNFSIFFLEINAGAKFTYLSKAPSMYNERLFYAIGPGSIPDVHIRIGIQF